MKYKTPEAQRLRAKARRDAIKATGGAEYEAMLVKERAVRAAFRKRHPTVAYEKDRHRKTRPSYLKTRLVLKARRRGRDMGLDATVRVSDIVWPSHCPVLGIELDYMTLAGGRRCGNPANPSLDRWDNMKGYTPGNVFVISFRANTLKSNATADELDAVARYARGALPKD